MHDPLHPLRKQDRSERQECPAPALRQSHRLTLRVGEASRTTVQLPIAKSVKALLRVPLRRDKAHLSPPQHSANPRDQLAATERFGHIIIGAKLQSHTAIVLIASVTRGDDDGYVGPGSGLTQ